MVSTRTSPLKVYGPAWFSSDHEIFPNTPDYEVSYHFRPVRMQKYKIYAKNNKIT